MKNDLKEIFGIKKILTPALLGLVGFILTFQLIAGFVSSSLTISDMVYIVVGLGLLRIIYELTMALFKAVEYLYRIANSSDN